MSATVSPFDYVELYIDHLEADRELKPGYLRWLRYCLGRFIEYAPDDLRDLSPRHLTDWTKSMRARNLKTGAIRSYQGGVWAFVRWLYTYEGPQGRILAYDLSRSVKRVTVRDEAVSRPTATDDVRKKLITVALDRPENPYRDAAIVELLWGSGMRRSELAALQYEDYDGRAGVMFIRKSKTGQSRHVGVTAAARMRLGEYLLVRGKAPGPLFYARRRHKGEAKCALTPNGVYQVVESLCLAAGVAYSPHSFRRAMASRLLREGAELDVVMSQGGWESSKMALQYGADGRTERALRAFHELDAGVRPMRRRGA